MKIVYFSETIAASDLKVGRRLGADILLNLCRQVSIEGQGHFLT